MTDALVQGVLLGGYYAVLAAGLSLMFGVMRIINLAHGSFYMAGAYMAFALAPVVGATFGGGFFATMFVGVVLVLMFSGEPQRLLGEGVAGVLLATGYTYFVAMLAAIYSQLASDAAGSEGR
jgi:branched-subunit amino acid ABC-type transport system permease component